MITRKIFWDDPYLTELDTEIISLDENTVELKETNIYAFSGGQASDSATIDGNVVIKAYKEDHQIKYILAPNHGLSVGEPVHIILDWDKRYKLMKLHFAAEIVLEWVYQNYNHPEKIGANISEDKARVDFYWDGNINKIFPELEVAVKKIIESDLSIISAYEDVDNEKRYWEIDGFAKVPCGGTHLKRTGEIGKLKFKRNNIGAGKERIEILLDVSSEEK